MSNRTAKRTLPLLSVLTLLAPLQSASAAGTSDQAAVMLTDITGKPVDVWSSTHFGAHLVKGAGGSGSPAVRSQLCQIGGQPTVAMLIEGQSEAFLLDMGGQLVGTISGPSKSDATAIVVLDLGNDGTDDALIGYEDGQLGLVKGLKAKHGNEAKGVMIIGAVTLLEVGDSAAYVATTKGDIVMLDNTDDGFLYPILQGVKGLRGLAAGDFDGDGVEDLAVATDTGVAVVSTEKPPASWSKAPPCWKGEPWALAAGDTDGDGVAELVVSEKKSGTIDVIRPWAMPSGNGTDTKIGKVLVTFGNAFGVGASLALVDLNDDGFAEICAGVGGASELVCVTPAAFEGFVKLDNTDDGFLRENSARFIADVPDFGATLSVGDIDGDGLIDLFAGAASVFGGIIDPLTSR